MEEIAVTQSSVQGTQGPKGDQGIQGPSGASERIHFAYADTVDGGLNFTTGAPGRREYQGIYTDFTDADSNNPADYTWSKYSGPPLFGLVATQGCEVGSDWVEKTASNTSWAAGAHSTESFVGGAAISFTVRDTTQGRFMIGFNPSPATSSSYLDMDCAMYYDEGNFRIYSEGSNVTPGGFSHTFVVGDTAQLVYNGLSCRVLLNGVEVLVLNDQPDKNYFLDVSLANMGSRVDGITWTAAGPAGPQGEKGNDGERTKTLIVYNRSVNKPAVPPAGVVYNFTTGEVSGLGGGWTQGFPAIVANSSQSVYSTYFEIVTTDNTFTVNSGWADVKKIMTGVSNYEQIDFNSLEDYDFFINEDYVRNDRLNFRSNGRLEFNRNNQIQVLGQANLVSMGAGNIVFSDDIFEIPNVAEASNWTYTGGASASSILIAPGAAKTIAGGSWSNSILSETAYTGGIEVGATVTSVGSSFMVGITLLDEFSSSTTEYTQITYSIYGRGSTGFDIRNNGAVIDVPQTSTMNAGDRLVIRYSDTKIEFLINNIVVHDLETDRGLKFKGALTIASNNKTVAGLHVGPYASPNRISQAGEMADNGPWVPIHVTNDSTIKTTDNIIEKIAGVQSWNQGDGAVGTRFPIKGGSHIRMTDLVGFGANNLFGMVGFTEQDPATMNSGLVYTKIDAGIYFNGAHGMNRSSVYGTNPATAVWSSAPSQKGWVWDLYYDEKFVYFYENGVFLSSFPAPIGKTLWAVVDFNYIGCKLKVEFSEYSNSEFARLGFDLTLPGSGITIGDLKNLPPIIALNTGYAQPVYLQVSNVTQTNATVTYPGGTVRLGSRTVSYNSASRTITDGAAGTNRFLWAYFIESPSPLQWGGSKTLYLTPSRLETQDSDLKVFLGQALINFADAQGGGGGGSGGGAGGSGGGGYGGGTGGLEVY